MEIERLNGKFGFTTKIIYEGGDVSFVGSNPIGGAWGVQYSQYRNTAWIDDGRGNVLYFDYKPEFNRSYSGFDAHIVLMNLVALVTRMIDNGSARNIRLIRSINGHKISRISYRTAKGMIDLYDSY